MRLISWNCHDGFAKKSSALLLLAPDIAVLSEVKEQDLEPFRPTASVAFAGASPKKGVAVVGFNGWQIEQVHPIEQKWFLPVVARRGSVHINVLAVWVIPTTNYVEPTLNELMRRREFLSREQAIVTGDFNHNVIFDKGRRGKRRFAAALEMFSELGFASVWHETKKEPHGNESSKSLFHMYNEAKAYHIDYAFASKSMMSAVTDVALGTYADWVKTKLSDHVPLSVTFEMPG
jgi:hypothetical protein